LKIFNFPSKIHSIFENCAEKLLENAHRRMPTLKIFNVGILQNHKNN